MNDYKELRAAGKSMHEKAFKASVELGFDALKIARRLTLPVSGRTLIFDDETDQNAFCDFWFHEYQVGGRSLVEIVDPVKIGLTELESKALEAYRRSRTSLFQIEGVHASEHQVRMRDLLEPEQPEFFLTDYGLSQSVSSHNMRAALFLRLVTAGDVRMSSGVFFVFPIPMVAKLLATYREEMKFVSPTALSQKRYIFFFKRCHVADVEQQYQDVPQSV